MLIVALMHLASDPFCSYTRPQLRAQDTAWLRSGAQRGSGVVPACHQQSELMRWAGRGQQSCLQMGGVACASLRTAAHPYSLHQVRCYLISIAMPGPLVHYACPLTRNQPNMLSRAAWPIPGQATAMTSRRCNSDCKSIAQIWVGSGHMQAHPQAEARIIDVRHGADVL